LRKITVLVALSIAIILSACATPISYDRTSAGNIRTIGLMIWGFPDSAQIIQGSSPHYNDLVSPILRSLRSGAFNRMLETHNFVVRDAFLERVTANLERDGYAVSLIEAERSGGYLLDLYPSEPPVDAYLNIFVYNYGYFAAYDGIIDGGGDIALFLSALGFGDSFPYRPAFVLVARLVRAGDHAVLMQDSIAYNPDSPSYGLNQANVTIAPTPEFEFVDFDALEKNPTKAVQGMQDATFKTADALSNLME
jgi:hypothetical protein